MINQICITITFVQHFRFIEKRIVENLFTSVLKATTVSIFGRFISLYFFTSTQILGELKINAFHKLFCFRVFCLVNWCFAYRNLLIETSFKMFYV